MRARRVSRGPVTGKAPWEREELTHERDRLFSDRFGVRCIVPIDRHRGRRRGRKDKNGKKRELIHGGPLIIVPKGTVARIVTGSDGNMGSPRIDSRGGRARSDQASTPGFFRGCSFGPELMEIPTMDRDVRDIGPSELEGFDAVVHLAALSNDPLGDIEPRRTPRSTPWRRSPSRELHARPAFPFVFASSCGCTAPRERTRRPTRARRSAP